MPRRFCLTWKHGKWHAQRKENMGFSIKMTPVLLASGRVGLQCSDLLWVSATVPRPLTCAKRPKMARPLNNAGLYQVRVHNRAFTFLISLQKWRGFFHLIARILAKNKKNLIYQCSYPYTDWFTITIRRQTQEIESPDYSTLILRFWR